jgi:Asp-tRNA(Asn)/Glu-tRNA(Gln) amidotransferase A subunit family amidase
MEPYKLTATKARRLLIDSKLSVRELAISCLSRIGFLEEKIRAWAYINPDLALNQADELDDILRKGKVQPRAIFGIPIGVKDIFNTLDMPTCMGSPIWKDFKPGNDARVVEEMRYNHAFIMGKTVTSEFAVHHPGATCNPHNINHTPGTSSSGSAAAVACQMVPIAIGTQTAGSTIRPASFNGIYGFKPSFGTIPRTGILKTLDTLDHVTLFARSPEDIEMMFSATRVRGRNYPFVHVNMDGISKQKEHGNFRVGFVKTHVWNNAEDYVQKDVCSFAETLSGLDKVELVEVKLPTDFDESHNIHNLIYEKSLSYYFAEEYSNYREMVSPVMRELIERGRSISKEEFYHGLSEQNRLSVHLDEFLADYDVIISFATAHDAPEGLDAIEQKDPCLMWTLFRVPSLNIPAFVSPRNLPFGVQVVAQRYRDYRILEFVKYLEQYGLAPQAPNPKLLK